MKPVTAAAPADKVPTAEAAVDTPAKTFTLSICPDRPVQNPVAFSYEKLKRFLISAAAASLPAISAIASDAATSAEIVDPTASFTEAGAATAPAAAGAAPIALAEDIFAPRLLFFEARSCEGRAPSAANPTISASAIIETFLIFFESP
jgi:hypothetical protein